MKNSRIHLYLLLKSFAKVSIFITYKRTTVLFIGKEDLFYKEKDRPKCGLTRSNGLHKGLFIRRGLEYALGHHGLGHLHEAGHIGTLHVVDVAVGLRAVLHAVGVNFVHYIM